ncbi:hypothetical protein PLICRDRAFT_33384 [Plicaturopsis crispa FD-325 SS-3]|nr:hypothetical protein PLICRDRAFT_33384 [Plicaturopsis crispa FD-325 SS-3]
MAVVASEARVSTLFDLPGSNVTLRSSDNVLFRVHKINLEMHSEAFAGATALPPVAADDIPMDAEERTVSLPETGEVLELLLQYMYLRPQPVLDKLKVKTLTALAEAAEKYQVYAAMQPCKMQMHFYLTSRSWSRFESDSVPWEMLLYAIKHHHHDLADEAALSTMSTHLRVAKNDLPAQWFAAWLSQREDWLELRQFASTAGERFHRKQYDDDEGYPGYTVRYECWKWTRIWSEVTDRLHRVKSPRDLEGVFHIEALDLLTGEEHDQINDPEAPPPEFLDEGCAKCDEGLARWKEVVMKRESTLRKLSSYLPAGTY